MHDKYLAVLSTMILTTGLSLPLTSTHCAQLRLTSMFKTVGVQQELSSLSPQLGAETAPTDRGAPDKGNRQGGGTHLI